MSITRLRARWLRPIAIFLLLDFSMTLVVPGAGLFGSGGGGPTSPTFASFSPVSGTNLVDLFSGDFNYNLPIITIPGPEGGSYPLSLSYNSGVSPDQEASWVGYGWTLNPGAITRNTNGFPDDYKEAEVSYYQRMDKHRTIGLSSSVGAEAFSISLAGTAGIRYNNYNGFAETYGFTLGAGGIASLSFTTTNGEGSWSGSINPAGALSLMSKKDKKGDDTPKQSKKTAFKSVLNKSASRGLSALGSVGSAYAMHHFSNQAYPVAVAPYTGESEKLQISAQGDPSFLPIGIEGSLAGLYSWQENDDSTETDVFGYMYSGESGITDEDMLDYSIERNDHFNKHDHYLPIPYSSPDDFVVSGEGLGGGFRAHHREIGQFRPNEVRNFTEIFDISLEVQLGSNIGVGVNMGTGGQSLDIGSWENEDTPPDFSTEGDEPCYFRFSGDMGGFLKYGDDLDAEQAGFDEQSSTPGNKAYFPTLPSGITQQATGDTRTSRSSYIAWHTNSDMETLTGGGLTPRRNAYTRDANALSFVDRGGAVADQVGEFAVWNAQGKRYTYGLPVYVRNEASLQYGLEGQSVTVDDNQTVYFSGSFDEDDLTRLSGHRQYTPYAKNWLLTSVTSQDYVDLTLDGPTDDDLGGWVRFEYDRAFGTDDKESASGNWYRWRVPYTGMDYVRGEMSDPRDDAGVVRYGEKEVYYVNTIDTRTHQAVFYTSDRSDAAEADVESDAAVDAAAIGGDHLQRLDSIVLFARENGVPTKRLKRVYFEYDYSLMKNRPGNDESDYNKSGVLTLRRVWTENYDTKDAKIAPHEFNYEYKDNSTYSTDVYARYGDICDYGSSWTSTAQNPDYHPAQSDPWGAYRYDGASRTDAFREWVDQAEAHADFDPGAWKLKQIVLPSGGEMLVQYEQGDYRYVQDKPAMGLVRLQNAGSDDANATYYLDLDDLEIDPSDTDALDDLVSQCRKTFIDGDEKIYFKYAYAIVGTNADFANCNTEFIEGYAPVAEVGRDGNDVYFVLGDPSDPSWYSTPNQLCIDFAHTQRRGLLDPSLSCGIRNNGTIDTEAGTESLVMALLNSLDEIGFNANDHCQDISWGDSYLRIPLTQDKKGGGVRVKRMLTYSPGLNERHAALYGQEFTYRTSEGFSSGVAAYEPPTINEENPLVNLLPREPQGWLNKVVGGRDKKEVEGPLGANIMPGASVGYSRVLSHNIHEGKTAPGFNENTYYTWKDYPIEIEATDIEEKKDWMMIPLGFYNSNINRKWVTQGYAFTFNDYSGKPRSAAIYTGRYDDPDNQALTAKTEYFYHEPGDALTLFDGFEKESAILGQQMEVTIAGQAVEDRLQDLSFETDASVGFLPPIPIPFVTLFPIYSDDQSDLYSHVITKVIRKPAVLRATNTLKDGVELLEELVMFDASTGTPLVSRTTDGFHQADLQQSSNHEGSIYAIGTQGSQAYREMGSKAVNEDFIMVSGEGVADGIAIDKVFESGEFKLHFDGDADHPVCNAMGMLYPGDLILVTDAGWSEESYFHVGQTAGSYITIYGSATYGYDGTDYSTSDVTIEIIRSGRTNELETSVGTIVTYGELPEETNTVYNFDPLRQALVAELNTFLNAGNSLFQIDLHMRYPNLEIDINKGVGNCDLRKISTLPNYKFMINDFTSSIGEGELCFRASDISSYDSSANSNNDCACLDAPIYFSPGDLPVGWFALDTAGTGDIVFYSADNPCNPQIVECLLGCQGPASWETLDGVLTTGVQTQDDDWSWDHDQLGYTDASYDTYNSYELGKRGKWRNEREYNYRTSRIGLNSSNPNGRNYNTGIFEDFILFQYGNTENSEELNWRRLKTKTSYLPGGKATESYNLLDIYSCSKYGYQQNLAYLVAENAGSGTVMFESFENTYNYGGVDYLEDGLVLSGLSGFVDNSTAHSGAQAFQITGGAMTAKRLELMKLSDEVIDQGVLLKFWARQSGVPHLNLGLRFDLELTDGYTTYTQDCEVVAKTGEWTLLECIVDAAALSGFSSGASLTPTLIFHRNFPVTVWVDDIRLQPFGSAARCYVYDPATFNLIAEFDDNHFGLYYLYDKAGNMTRRVLETTQGRKTVAESYLHTRTINR